MSKIELYSNEFYSACILGGIVACGPTHSSVAPLDLVKCRLQVNPTLYKSNFDGWKTIIRTEGLNKIFTGIGATFIGYSLQGAGKYGGYEFFKHFYTHNVINPDLARRHLTSVYLTASATAEFFADIMLCPFEAIKVRQQTTIPPYCNNVFQGLTKLYGAEGLSGFYKGIVPLWSRQIPYTMCKFTSFEEIVKAIYSKIPTPKEQLSSLSQISVSFLGGYLAGILCAIISHPADVMVSKINSEKKEGESMTQCSKRIYKHIGFGGLWNGLPVRILMVGTLTSFQWLIYDSFKVRVGLPTTG